MDVHVTEQTEKCNPQDENNEGPYRNCGESQDERDQIQYRCQRGKAPNDLSVDLQREGTFVSLFGFMSS